MKPFELAQDVFWSGAMHPELKVFDDLLPTRRGTTYNSYLVRGRKTAVIDTVKEMFAGGYLRGLATLVDLRKLDFIVVNHAEPDHSGALAALMDAAPQARVFASKPARLYLKDLLNRPFDCSTVEETPELDLGGKTLRFISAPFMHWPDTIFTWLAEDRILFSCDAFGAHVCDERMWNDEVAGLETDFRLYYDALMRPYRDRVLAAVERARELDLTMIAPSHGPILRADPRASVEKYRAWATLPEAAKATVAVLYMSAHHNTERMAQAIAEGAKRAGVNVEVLHVTETDEGRMRAAMENADGLIFGTPTIVRDAPPAMWRALSLLSTVKVRARKAAAFGSYGWSGEASAMIEQRLKDLHIPVVSSGLRVKFAPDGEDLDACRAFGESFASTVAGGG